MKKVGLLGWPVAHSLSPVMHNAAFESLGLNWRYDLLPAHPDCLDITLAGFMEQGYRGFNITVPHKQAVLALPMVSSVSDAVQTMGAANTLTLKADGSFHANNTDWRGFLDDLLFHRIDPAGMHCLILGMGGSSKAVEYALKKVGAASIRFASRSRTEQSDILSYDNLNDLAETIDLIINTTPVGMSPQIEDSPLPDDFPFKAGTTLYDLIYNPAETRLMRIAESAGVRVVGGLGMLVRQGAASFEQWTEQEPSIDIMMTVAREELESRNRE